MDILKSNNDLLTRQIAAAQRIISEWAPHDHVIHACGWGLSAPETALVVRPAPVLASSSSGTSREVSCHPGERRP